VTKEVDKAAEIIEKHHVIVWHRLLKSIYHEPQEVECELITEYQEGVPPDKAILRRTNDISKLQVLNTSAENVKKIQEGNIIFSNWKYYFSLPSGAIVSIGTQNRCTSIRATIVLCGKKPNTKDNEEAYSFISLLGSEAAKSHEQLFNPKNEFSKKREGLQSYGVFNVYLSNYKSAKHMFDTANILEENLQTEFKRYDATRLDLKQDEITHIDEHMLVCGMYFSSAITFLFTSLEGFINLIFQTFLKKSLRDSHLNIEKRLDIEQKYRLLPSLCYGFTQTEIDAPSDIYSLFRKLTDYRNLVVHSKIDSSLKSMGFIEDGFFYQWFPKNDFLPSLKIQLSANDVLQVKDIVDGLIISVLGAMTESAKALTTEYILKAPVLTYHVSPDGTTSLKTGVIKKIETEPQQKHPAERD
jgi:hypothetical protein